MPRRFRKKAGLSGALSLPGMPGIGNDTIVEGDEYARFCPAVLEEVFDTSAPRPAVAPVVTAPVPEPEPEPEPVPEPEEEPEAPNMGWSKAELVDYAKVLGIDVQGLSKAQLLNAIEAAEK